MRQHPLHRVPRGALAPAPPAPLIGLHDPARDDRPVRLHPLPHRDEAELVKTGERGQVRASEGSVRHVEVFRIRRVGTLILRRPRPLPPHRRADHGEVRSYTLDWEEPQNPAKSQTRLAPERRAELVADYVAGTPVRAIATKYGVHRGTIPTLVRRAGSEVRAAGLDAEESKLASSLYENGMTLAQVAAQMGISDEAVRQAVLNQGWQIRPKGRRPRR